LEVVPSIHWIDGVNGNCYLIVEEELTLIDTGLPRNTRKILRYITDEVHRQPSDLKTIVLTHSHLDHIGNARPLRDITGAKIAAHTEDAQYIEGRMAMPGPKGAIGIVFKLMVPLIRVSKFKVDALLNDGDRIAGLEVVHVPGHTPGSIALRDQKNKVLFTGDALTYRGGKVTGPPSKFTIDPERARGSIEKMKSLEFEVMLGGHGEPLMPNASARVRESTGT
jgi:glyoxylase-like metal-dependent hydrolase (beta-lactamase superfamily II)